VEGSGGKMAKILVRGEPRNNKDLMTLQEVIDYLTMMGKKWDLIGRPTRFFIEQGPGIEYNVKTVFGFDGEFAAISLVPAKKPLPRDDES